MCTFYINEATTCGHKKFIKYFLKMRTCVKIIINLNPHSHAYTHSFIQENNNQRRVKQNLANLDDIS